MKVNLIGKLGQINAVEKIKRVHTNKTEVKADKVEISRRAKELARTKEAISPERMAEIKKRVEEKYYDREEVLQKVAENILNSPAFKEVVERNKLDKNI